MGVTGPPTHPQNLAQAPAPVVHGSDLVFSLPSQMEGQVGEGLSWWWSDTGQRVRRCACAIQPVAEARPCPHCSSDISQKGAGSPRPHDAQDLGSILELRERGQRHGVEFLCPPVFLLPVTKRTFFLVIFVFNSSTGVSLTHENTHMLEEFSLISFDPGTHWEAVITIRTVTAR